jgi:hypothetical protein
LDWLFFQRGLDNEGLAGLGIADELLSLLFAKAELSMLVCPDDVGQPGLILEGKSHRRADLNLRDAEVRNLLWLFNAESGRF